jgi:hypothetical protein
MKFLPREKIKLFFYYFINFFLGKKTPTDSEVEMLLNKKIPPLHINFNTKYVFNQTKYKKSFINDYLFNYFYNIISELQKKRNDFSH